MKYVVWTEADFEGLGKMRLVKLYTEIDGEGQVHREVGIDADGRVCHRSSTTPNTYGLFDNVMVQAQEEQGISEQAFEDVWRLDHDCA